MTKQDDFCLPPGGDGMEAAPALENESVSSPGADVGMEKESDVPADSSETLAPAEFVGAGDSACASGMAAALMPERKESLSRFLGIRLRKAGQVFFFPDDEHVVRTGSKVLVDLEHGLALGEVASIIHGGSSLPKDEENPRMQGRVVGLATAQDIALHTENSILAAEAAAFCKTCIRQRCLEMKLITVEVLHDRSKIIFFFTAPSRIDFRELVKDLVRNYRTRIELRQIGVRHETQMIGGIGNCGMVCCCHKYLRKFAPVTIKMAKEQNLFLNPAKLSGMCGRLLCCLSFEQNNYEEFNRRCPKPGKKYATAKGTVKVLRANLFSQKICILAENGEETELSLEEWDALDLRRAEQASAEAQHPASTEGKGKERRREQDRNYENDTGAGGYPPGGPLDPESGKSAAATSEYEADRQLRQRKRRRRPE